MARERPLQTCRSCDSTCVAQSMDAGRDFKVHTILRNRPHLQRPSPKLIASGANRGKRRVKCPLATGGEDKQKKNRENFGSYK